MNNYCLISFYYPKRLCKKKIRVHPSQLGNLLTIIRRFIDSIRVYQDANRYVSLFAGAIYLETWYQNVHTWKEILSRCHHDESNGRVISIAWICHYGDIGGGWERDARFLAGLGSEQSDGDRVSEQSAGTQVLASEVVNTSYDRLPADLCHWRLR